MNTNPLTIRSAPSRRGRRLLVWAALACALSGCEETLPPREPPRTVLQPSLTVTRPGEVILRDSVLQGTGGSFLAVVKNIYDEVLQDSGRIRLKLDITMLNEPKGTILTAGPAALSASASRVRTVAHTAHVEADEEYLVNWREYKGGILTLGIDTSAVIRRQWDHKTSEGIPFWTLVNLYPGATPGGEAYLLSDTVRYRVEGTVQIFKVVQPQVLPAREVWMVYKIFENALPGWRSSPIRVRPGEIVQ
jgi:hypothetical protein